MSSAPLPQPADPVRIEAVGELLASVVEDKNATYVSVPLTSGRRFINWFKTRGAQLEPNSKEYKRELLQSVIRPNCEDVAKRVAELRKSTNFVVINPAAFDRPDWNQDDYRYFWGYIIERFVDRVIFKDDWQFSSWCGYEFLRCIRSGIAAFTENGKELGAKQGLTLIEQAITDMRAADAPTLFLERIHNELSGDLRRFSGEIVSLPHTGADQQKVDRIRERSHSKDAVLNELASVANIAQFVSFGPEGQRFSRVRGFSQNHVFPTPNEAVSALLETSPVGKVNVRIFFPEHPPGEPLVYGLRAVDSV